MLAPPDPIARGREAWARLREHHRTSWDEWRTVGEAVKIGRETALRAAGCKTPYGKRYTAIFGDWLIANGLDGINQQVRYRLLVCLDNIDAIERWRAGLPPAVRNKYGHPDSIWMNFSRRHEPAREPASRRCIEHRPQPANAARPARAGRPDGDMIRRVARALRENWTTDTFKLALVAIQAVADDPDLGALFAPKQLPQPRKPAPVELHA